MLNQTPPYFFWSTWHYFSTLEKLLLLALGFLGVYSIFSVVTTMTSVWKNKRAIQKGSGAELQPIFVAIHKRSARLRNLIGAAFYLFGMVLFLSLQSAYMTIDNSTTPGGWLVLQNFGVHFVFAFNAFLAFLILHLLTWTVSTSVHTFGLQLKAQGQ